MILGAPNGDGVVFPTKSGGRDEMELRDYFSEERRSSTRNLFFFSKNLKIQKKIEPNPKFRFQHKQRG